MPVCNNCFEDLHRTCFSYVKKDNTGICKECQKLVARERKEAAKAFADGFKDGSLRKPSKVALGRYFIKYGISEQDYGRMFIEQDGRCLICGQKDTSKKLCVDHNHLTGDVRGLLCSRCNSMIGFAKENPTTLMNGAIYLMKTQRSVLDIEVSRLCEENSCLPNEDQNNG